MAADSGSLAGYDQHTHHHQLMSHQQHQTGTHPIATPEAYPPRRTDVSHLHSPTSAGPCMTPTWHGFVHTTYDALMVLEACLQGRLSHIPRRPHDRERTQIITGGNVFIYEENASGIKRWTDGVTWSPSRIMGNFLVYRELSEPFPAGEKKKAKKRKRGSEEAEQFTSQNMYSEEDRKLVGSLVDSYGFKPNGLIKKTLNVKYNGVSHHIVSYYCLEDVKAGRHKRPRHDPLFVDIKPREELIANPFKVSAIDNEEDMYPMDPFHTGLTMAMPAPVMFGQPPALQIQTGDHGLPTPDQAFAQLTASAISQSPHSSMSSSQTPVDYFPFAYSQGDSQYIAHGMINGLSHAAQRGPRMDSVVQGQQSQVKYEGTSPLEAPEMPVHFTSAADDSSPLATALAQSAGEATDMFGLPNNPVHFSHMDHQQQTSQIDQQQLAGLMSHQQSGHIDHQQSNHPAAWAFQSAAYQEHMLMPQPKRVQMGSVTAIDGLAERQAQHFRSHLQYAHPQPFHVQATGSSGTYVV